MTAVPRLALGLVALAFLLWLAVLSSFAFGTYYLTDTGTDRLRGQASNLLLACVFGVGGVAAFLAILGRRVWSPWLLLGFAPTAVASANHLGLIG
jgi:hypothetical protein